MLFHPIKSVFDNSKFNLFSASLLQPFKITERIATLKYEDVIRVCRALLPLSDFKCFELTTKGERCIEKKLLHFLSLYQTPIQQTKTEWLLHLLIKMSAIWYLKYLLNKDYPVPQECMETFSCCEERKKRWTVKN